MHKMSFYVIVIKKLFNIVWKNNSVLECKHPCERIYRMKCLWFLLEPIRKKCYISTPIFQSSKEIHTIRDVILTCARKPTWVSLIYHMEPTTKKCKNRKKTKTCMLWCMCWKFTMYNWFLCKAVMLVFCFAFQTEKDLQYFCWHG